MDEIEKPDNEMFYLPHHCVEKEASTTTKLPVVFDASAITTSGTSLNDILLTGPRLQDDLFEILLRFRFHRIGLTADVEKMYRQIALNSPDKDFHRILWRERKSESLKTYRMTRVTYGVRSSANHSTRALQETAHVEYDSQTTAVVLRDFAVDDLLTGASSLEDALELQKRITTQLKKAGFILRKWSSSNSEFMHRLPEALQEAPSAYIIEDRNHSFKVLGIKWIPLDDYFCFTTREFEVDNPTKRQLLSDIAKLYNPLGWLSPAIIKFKLLIQETWLAGVGWDEAVGDSIATKWRSAKDTFSDLAQIKLNRCVLPAGKICTTELHVFCDASERAYAAVVYSRIQDDLGTIRVQLLSAKSKVAPIKRVSLPRLELCAANLGGKLVTICKDALEKMDVQIDSIHGWTDSTIVLSWLADYPSNWSTFVGNRVSSIQKAIPPEQWGHVDSSNNPADCASRGLLSQELTTYQPWWDGPSWLTTDCNHWPQQPVVPKMMPLERRKNKTVALAVASPPAPVIDVERFSQWRRLMATMKRIVLLTSRIKSNEEYSKLDEVTAHLKARNVLLKLHQQHHFATEINQIIGQKLYTGKLLPLSPFFDNEDNLLRVGGRLSQSNYNEVNKFPIIVAGDTHFATLLIRDAHQNTLHGGPQATLYKLRQEFWITGGVKTVARIIKQCITCIRFSKSTHQPQMGDLPAERISSNRTFTNVGLDFGGPIHFKITKGKLEKAYIALFICMATKAIHIEVVSSLTTAACVAALRRFVERRGLPSAIFSDNGAILLVPEVSFQRFKTS